MSLFSPVPTSESREGQPLALHETASASDGEKGEHLTIAAGQDLSFTLKTRTPLWMGDYYRKNAWRPSALMGSLRWWCEAILRTWAPVCDPTSNDRCSQGSPCLGCQLFGWQGGASRVTLDCPEPKKVSVCFPGIPTLTRPHRQRRSEGWHVPNLGLAWRINAPLEGYQRQALRTTLLLVDQWGALGARSSQGCGVVCLKEQSETEQPELTTILTELSSSLQSHQVAANDDKPSLKNFFSLEFELDLRGATLSNCLDEKSGVRPLAFPVRDLLRRAWGGRHQEQLRHALMGQVRGKTVTTSLIRVSHAWRSNDVFRLRIFGFIPNEYDRSVVIPTIEEVMQQGSSHRCFTPQFTPQFSRDFARLYGSFWAAPNPRSQTPWHDTVRPVLRPLF